MGIYTEKERLLTFVIMGLVVLTLVQDTFSIFIPYHSGNFRKPGTRRSSVRVIVRVPGTTVPSTKAPTTASNEKVPNSTPSNAEPTTLYQEDDISLTSSDTAHIQRPTTAVSKGIPGITGGDGVNNTRFPPIETSGVDTTGNDCISFSREGDGGQSDIAPASSLADYAKIKEEQIFLKSKGCFTVMFDEEIGNFAFENPAITYETMKHKQVLEDLETTLNCISVTAEIISFVFLTVIRVSRSERIFVHKNLLVSLALGQVVYIIDIKILTMKEHHTICSIYAVIQHYLHTSLYTWMLVEGINLYLKMVKVFSFGKPYMIYALLGWGIPGVIVGLVAAFQPSTFDMGTILYKEINCGELNFTGTVDRERCWLNGSVWKFTGPALVILLANLAVFFMVLRVSFDKIGRNRSLSETTRKRLKAILALLPLLGVTFLLGFFIHFHVAVEYAFVFLNSIQGILFFICHCVLDDQVRDAVKKMLRKNKRGHSL